MTDHNPNPTVITEQNTGPPPDYGLRTESPLTTARRYADRDIRNLATVSEMKWLFDQPILWLRGLNHIRGDILHRMEMKRIDVIRLKPQPGQQPSTKEVLAYHEAKDTAAIEGQRRMDFMRRVERKIEEVKVLIGAERVYVLGDVVNVMSRIAQLAEDDDIEAVKDVALFYAEQWAKDGYPHANPPRKGKS